MAEVRTLQDHYRKSSWEERTNHKKEADGGRTPVTERLQWKNTSMLSRSM